MVIGSGKREDGRILTVAVTDPEALKHICTNCEGGCNSV